MDVSTLLPPLRALLAAAFAALSVAAVILTVYDKSAAKKHKRRVPERTLLLVAAFGGALSMYVTMQLIRHKTQHSKFMIPLPLFILAHLVAAWALFLR